jgi:small-conductance mechanosensitive channel
MNGITTITLVVGVIAAATLTRVVLKWGAKNKNWAWLRLLTPSVSNLIYIFGLQILIDVVPFQPIVLRWLDDTAYVLAVIILFGIARRALFIAMDWSALRTNSPVTLKEGFIPLLRNVITLFVFLSGGIMVLKRFNYDVMSLVTALGVSSLAVGLAAKETLSNMISGFTLIIDRNLKPGDRINLVGTVGEVGDIGLRSTRIKTGDGNLLIVPNSELVNTRILNLSSPSPQTSCSTTIRVPMDTPFEAIKALCLKAISEVEKIHQPKGNWVHLTSLSDGHQLITIGFWVARVEDQGSAISEFNQKLLKLLSQEKIALLSPIISSAK